MAGKIIITTLIVLSVCSTGIGKIGGGDIYFKIGGKTGDVVFSHETHVKDADIKCNVCHIRLYTTKEKHKRITMAQMEKGRSCGMCHNGEKAFSVKSDCTSCHKKQ
ncbi:MAG: cytochrome c3 family protein [Syntrophorhabdaceae bacterium]|nr:cytochrome c3 family protein [Syntrophorhabdaceae bacterium]